MPTNASTFSLIAQNDLQTGSLCCQQYFRRKYVCWCYSVYLNQGVTKKFNSGATKKKKKNSVFVVSDVVVSETQTTKLQRACWLVSSGHFLREGHQMEKSYLRTLSKILLWSVVYERQYCLIFLNLFSTTTDYNYCYQSGFKIPMAVALRSTKYINTCTFHLSDKIFKSFI